MSPDHGCVVVNEDTELLSELFLERRANFLVGRGVQAAARDLGGEPVRLGESDGQGNEVFLDLLRGELIADLVERLDSL